MNDIVFNDRLSQWASSTSSNSQLTSTRFISVPGRPPTSVWTVLRRIAFHPDHRSLATQLRHQRNFQRLQPVTLGHVPRKVLHTWFVIWFTAWLITCLILIMFTFVNCGGLPHYKQCHFVPVCRCYDLCFMQKWFLVRAIRINYQKLFQLFLLDSFSWGHLKINKKWGGCRTRLFDFD